MNHNDKIDFNGKQVTIKDLFEMEPRELLVHIVIELRALKSIPNRVEKNGKDLAWVKGTLAILTLIIGCMVARII